MADVVIGIAPVGPLVSRYGGPIVRFFARKAEEDIRHPFEEEIKDEGKQAIKDRFVGRNPDRPLTLLEALADAGDFKLDDKSLGFKFKRVSLPVVTSAESLDVELPPMHRRDP